MRMYTYIGVYIYIHVYKIMHNICVCEYIYI